MYTVIWARDGLRCRVMNEYELDEFLNDGEGSEINWCPTAHLFNLQKECQGIILKGDAIVPKEKTIRKLSV